MLRPLYLLTLYSCFVVSIYLLIKKKLSLAFVLFILIGVLCETYYFISKNFGVRYPNSHLYLIYSYTSVVYISLTAFYYQNIENKKIRFYFIIYNFFFLIILLYSLVKFDYSTREYNMNFVYIAMIHNIILSLMHFLDLVYRDTIQEKIGANYSFWISIAVLLWSTLNIFRFICLKYFDQHDNRFLILILDGFMLINLITYLLIFKGLTCLWSKR